MPLADQDAVSARARQLNHRLKNRKNAIIGRREAEAPASDDYLGRSPKASGGGRAADLGQLTYQANGGRRASASPSSGFVAVNSRQAAPESALDSYAHDPARTANVTILNGTSLHGASAATRAELLSKFFTTSERTASSDHESRRSSVPTSRTSATNKSKPKTNPDNVDYANILLNSASPVPIPNTPSSLLPYVKPSPADRFDDSGPYKAEMVARMEQLQRGDRIQPPCDRCRRLHMDCLKNLTACMGCTKKHAKCSWKDVIDDELRENPYIPHNSPDEGADGSSDREGYPNAPGGLEKAAKREYSRDDRKGVRDEELLGEDASGDEDEERENQEADDVGRQKPNPVHAAAEGKVAPTTTTNHPPSKADVDAKGVSERNNEPQTSGPEPQENQKGDQPINGDNTPNANTNGNADTDGDDAITDLDSETLLDPDTDHKPPTTKPSASESVYDQLQSAALKHPDQSEMVLSAVYAPTAPLPVSAGTRG